jgi:hypothetical protein
LTNEVKAASQTPQQHPQFEHTASEIHQAPSLLSPACISSLKCVGRRVAREQILVFLISAPVIIACATGRPFCTEKHNFDVKI